MKRDQLKIWIKENSFGKKRLKTGKKFWNSHEKEFQSLIHFTNFLEPDSDISERIYCLLNDITEKKICEGYQCENEVEFLNFSKGYQKFCSYSCVHRNRKLDEIHKKKISESLKSSHRDHSHVKSSNFRRRMSKLMKEKWERGDFQGRRCGKEKRALTCEKKFGVKTNLILFNEEQRKKARISRIENGNMCDDRNVDTSQWEQMEKWEIIDKFKLSRFTVNKIIEEKGIRVKPPRKSKFQAEVENFVISIWNGDIIFNDRKILPNRHELDIFIPGKSFAIECNGLFHHSFENGKDRNYHLWKTEECESRGIDLIHIFEDDWKFNREICESIIKSRLGIFEKRIHARKCEFSEISKEEAREFLNQNHIQGGSCSINKAFGLFFNDQLVSTMTFGIHHRNNSQIVLNRFASLLNHQIIGGASKLFKNSGVKECISWSDRSIFNGNVYRRIGFKLDKILPPDHSYFSKEFPFRQNKQRFTKTKLKDQILPGETESQHMRRLGFFKIFDCGKIRWKFR